MRYDFSNKVVWITGASSGIGKKVALELLKLNAIVVVTARNKSVLSEVFEKYNNAVIAEGDVTHLETSLDIVQKIQAQFSRLDCVILNAGTAEYIDIKQFDHGVFEHMINVNFLSMTKCIQAALPALRNSENPYLVGMSSSVAWQGLPQGQAYSASKAAIRNLFQGLKIELSVEYIQVSWICPGFVKTPLTNKNDFDMPFQITSDKAASIIVKQLIKQVTEIHFPKRFTYLLKMISMLPANWAAKLLKRTVPSR